jgi:putative transposase
LGQAETYRLLCQRDIELTPVRAAMVADPAEYRWSSDRHHALGAPSGILFPHEAYRALGNSAAARQKAYRDLFMTGLDDEPTGALRMALNQSQPVGNQRLYAQIEAATGQRRELKKRGRTRRRTDGESFPGGEQGELAL